ncbi:MAG: MBL fold metallo-hydrolase [Candidatus Eisenbacteria bacterium]|nr:MBL fold metallo-hydrolase [Candidatus Eisenbacteria bacterium]
MKITFWGAVGGTTGTRTLLEVRGRKMLLDCGLFQGRREEAEAKNRRFPFAADEVDCVVLSHAHIDHSGNLPGLVRDGFRGSIHATRATIDLCDPMLRDSAHIQERDVEFVNKRRARKKQKPKEPIYTEAHAEQTQPLFVGHDYHRPFDVIPGVRATFFDAGHILGSAITVLEIEEGGRRLRLGFTGDLGRPDLPIIRDPETVEGLEVLITESTYGNRLHEETGEIPDLMAGLLNRVHARGGKVIIPAFAVGRTQEIVSVLKDLFSSQRVPRMPVYVDSPLAVNVTDVFRRHPECFDEDALALLNEEHTDPFGFRLMHYVRDVEESKALNTKDGPMIIISASGMCEAGRILHHLRNNIEDPRALILVVGFMAENTLGRKLVEGWDEVRIFGEEFPRQAEVAVLNAFSAHADRNELLAWTTGLGPPPQRCFVVHGETDQAEAFAARLSEQKGFDDVRIPELGRAYTL